MLCVILSKEPECANETLGTAFTMQFLGASISLLLAVVTIILVAAGRWISQTNGGRFRFRNDFESN